MNQCGRRNGGWSAVSHTIPDLRIANYDEMRRDVSVEITDERDETVLEAERSLARGGDATLRSVFRAAGTHHVTVSLRYGERARAALSVTPRRTGLCIDIHTDGIDTYSLPR